MSRAKNAGFIDKAASKAEQTKSPTVNQIRTLNTLMKAVEIKALVGLNILSIFCSVVISLTP